MNPATKTKRKQAPPPGIAAVLRRQAVEEPHARQVAALALKLFDRMRSRTECTPADRRRLEYAAWLHDIGYAAHGRRHAAAGGEWIRKLRLPGIKGAELRMIARLAALHERSIRLPRGRPGQLAALLRVADGLDHGHVQDAAILGLRRLRGGWQLRVCSPAYAGNVGWAQGKADGCWKRAFGGGLEIRAAGEKPDPAGVACVRRDAAPADALRRMMTLQLRMFADLRAAVRAGAPPADLLHDARIALRRLRETLRLASALPWPPAETLVKKCETVTRRLGPLRDREVEQEWLERLSRREEFARGAAWRAWRKQRARAAARVRVRLPAIIAGPDAAALGAEGLRLLRVEWYRKPPPAGGRAERYFAARLAAAGERLRARRRKTTWGRAASMHDLRRVCRRERYLAEFAAPVLGKPIQRFARRLRQVSTQLGKLHDVDMLLGLIFPEQGQAARAVRGRLRRERKKLLRRCREEWGRLMKPKALRKISQVLAEA